MPDEVIQWRALLEGDEAKPFAPPRFTVDHDRGVHDRTMLCKVLLQCLGSDSRSKSSNEYLLRTLMFESGNSAFWIDLRVPTPVNSRNGGACW